MSFYARFLRLVAIRISASLLSTGFPLVMLNPDLRRTGLPFLHLGTIYITVDGAENEGHCSENASSNYQDEASRMMFHRTTVLSQAGV